MFFKRKKKTISVPVGNTEFWWMRGNCIVCCADRVSNNPPEYTIRLGNERIGICEEHAKQLRDRLNLEFGRI